MRHTWGVEGSTVWLSLGNVDVHVHTICCVIPCHLFLLKGQCQFCSKLRSKPWRSLHDYRAMLFTLHTLFQIQLVVLGNLCSPNTMNILFLSTVPDAPGETGIPLEWKQGTPLCSRIATCISWSSLGGLKGVTFCVLISHLQGKGINGSCAIVFFQKAHVFIHVKHQNCSQKILNNQSLFKIVLIYLGLSLFVNFIYLFIFNLNLFILIRG